MGLPQLSVSVPLTVGSLSGSESVTVTLRTVSLFTVTGCDFLTCRLSTVSCGMVSSALNVAKPIAAKLARITKATRAMIYI